MNTLKYIESRLDDIDADIMERYPEEQHAWLYNMIAEKVDLELKRSEMMKDSK